MVVADERFLIELKATGNAEEAFENLARKVEEVRRILVDGSSRGSKAAEEMGRSASRATREVRDEVVRARDAYGRFVRTAEEGSDDVRRSTKQARDEFGRFVSTGTKGTNVLKKDVNDLGKSLRKLGIAAAALGAAYFTVRQAIDLSRLASEAEETQSKFNALFDGLEDRANGLATGLAESLGRAPTDIQDAIAGFQALLTPMGLANEEGLELSSTLTRLGLDLSSFFNTAEDDAFLALRSALIGETEPLRRYGVNLLDVRVRQEAVRLGLAETSAAADDQARVLARLSLILQDTDTAQGDLIRTQDSFANSLRALRSQLRGAQIEAGQRINEAVLQGIEDAGGVERVTQLFASGYETIAEFTRFGIAGLVEFAKTGLEAIDALGGPEGVQRVIANTVDFSIVKLRFIGAEVRQVLEPVFDTLEFLGESLGGPAPLSLDRQLEVAKELQRRLADVQNQIPNLESEANSLTRQAAVIAGGGVSALQDADNRAIVQAATEAQANLALAERRLETIRGGLAELDPIVFELLEAQDRLDSSLAPLGEQGFGDLFESAQSALDATDFDAIAQQIADGAFGRQAQLYAGQNGERAGQAYAEGIARYLNAIGPEVFAAGQEANFRELERELQIELAELRDDQAFVIRAEADARLANIDSMVIENALLDDQAEKLSRLVKRLRDKQLAEVEGAGSSFTLSGGLEALGDAAQQAGTQGLASLIEGSSDGAQALQILQSALARALAQFAAAGLIDFFGGLFSGGPAINPAGSGVFSLGPFGAIPIPGFAGGGVVQGPSTALGALPLNFYAGGGIVDSPQLFVAGEGQSAEAIVPMPNGAVPVQFTNGGGGGGGNTVVVNLNVSALDGQDAARVLQGQLGTIQAAVIEGLQGGNRGLIESVRGVNA